MKEFLWCFFTFKNAIEFLWQFKSVLQLINWWITWIYFQIWRPRVGDVVPRGDIIHTGVWRKPFLWCWGDHQREAEATIPGLERWAEIVVQVHLIYTYCKIINSCFMLCEDFHIVFHLKGKKKVILHRNSKFSQNVYSLVVGEIFVCAHIKP